MSPSFSAVCYMEFWKRYQNVLRYEWDVAEFELEEVSQLESMQFIEYKCNVYNVYTRNNQQGK